MVLCAFPPQRPCPISVSKVRRARERSRLGLAGHVAGTTGKVYDTHPTTVGPARSLEPPLASALAMSGSVIDICSSPFINCWSTPLHCQLHVCYLCTAGVLAGGSPTTTQSLRRTGPNPPHLSTLLPSMP